MAQQQNHCRDIDMKVLTNVTKEPQESPCFCISLEKVKVYKLYFLSVNIVQTTLITSGMETAE